jgi:hypothetical protein
MKGKLFLLTHILGEFGVTPYQFLHLLSGNKLFHINYVNETILNHNLYDNIYFLELRHGHRFKSNLKPLWICHDSIFNEKQPVFCVKILNAISFRGVYLDVEKVPEKVMFDEVRKLINRDDFHYIFIDGFVKVLYIVEPINKKDAIKIAEGYESNIPSEVLAELL